MAKMYILPYFRKGLSNSITAHGGLKQKRATLKVSLGMELKQKDKDKVEEQKLDGQVIEVMGPADVKSLQKKSIILAYPPDNTKTRLFKGYMPYIQFFEEDLPWRYTPVATGDETFRPWITLVAVKEDEVSFGVNSNGVKFATLQIDSDQRYQEIFPDMQLLSKVAHVQIDSNVPVNQDNVNALLDENPDCGFSRILCTSKLEVSSTYMVLLVPTYELGRLAGLGHSVNDVMLGQCAWDNKLKNQKKRPDGLTFPVYYKWKFKTSKVTADFKTLASYLFFTGEKEYDQMKPFLDVDVSQSGLGDVYYDEEMVVDVPPALILDKKDEELRMEDVAYTSALKELLELNPVLEENETGEINMEEDPWIVPPVYGARHLLTTKTEFANSRTNIVKEVNLQLKNRVAAGMGSTVVKKNQEQFVNRAWKKVEKINQLNQAIREYYQMQQVDEKAKSRVCNTGHKVTPKNKALVLDVANRSLQTAGIYRKQISADNLLEASKGMDAVGKQKQRVNCGITVNELKELFSTEVWEDIIKRDAIRNLLTEPKPEDFFDIFDEYQILNLLGFSVKKDEEGKFQLSAKQLEMALPNPVLNTIDYKNIWLNWVQDNKISDDFFSSLEHFAANRKPLFERFQSNALNKYPLILEDKYGNVGVIVQNMDSFKAISKGKPVVVEYNGGKYYYILPLDYVKSQKNLDFQLRIEDVFWGVSTGISASISLRLVSPNGLFSPVMEIWNNIIDITQSANYNNLKEMRDRLASAEVVIYKSKKKNISFDFISGVSCKLKENGQSWLQLNDFRFNFTLTNPRYSSFWSKVSDEHVKVAGRAMADVLTKVLDDAEKLKKHIFEPTHLVLNTLTPQSEDLVKVNAEKIVATGNYDSEIYGVFEWKSVKKQLDSLNEDMTRELNMELELDEVVEEVDPEIIDPTAIANNRMNEILAKYGYTEDNQLKSNLLNNEENICGSKYPVMAYPDFLDPTFFYLRECSVNYVIPSAGSLLKDSITYFRSNPQFEEAFLMGMNTEMGQELLWREYPTDQRGSYFRKFWDQENLPEKNNLDKYYDVKPVHQWKDCLGQNHMLGKDAMLVFVIRGELMCSYPNTSVYLSEGNKLEKKISPSMTSWLTDEIYIVGFEGLQSDELAGYYLTFEQQILSLNFEREKGDNSIAGEFDVVIPQIYAIPLQNRNK